jgi:hypothetical protein
MASLTFTHTFFWIPYEVSRYHNKTSQTISKYDNIHFIEQINEHLILLFAKEYS